MGRGCKEGRDNLEARGGGDGAGRKKGPGQGERRRGQALMRLIHSQPAEC